MASRREQFYAAWRDVRILLGNAPMNRARAISTRHHKRHNAHMGAALSCWAYSGKRGHTLGYPAGIPAAIRDGMQIPARLAYVRRVRELRLADA